MIVAYDAAIVTKSLLGDLSMGKQEKRQICHIFRIVSSEIEKIKGDTNRQNLLVWTMCALCPAMPIEDLVDTQNIIAFYNLLICHNATTHDPSFIQCFLSFLSFIASARFFLDSIFNMNIHFSRCRWQLHWIFHFSWTHTKFNTKKERER